MVEMGSWRIGDSLQSMVGERRRSEEWPTLAARAARMRLWRKISGGAVPIRARWAGPGPALRAEVGREQARRGLVGEQVAAVQLAEVAGGETAGARRRQQPE